MKEIIKKLMPSFLTRFIIKQINLVRYRNWENQGCKIPPPSFVKQRVVQTYSDIYTCNIFIETGTYLGDMVAFQKDSFKQIYSIELDNDLFEKAKKRFKSNSLINILKGDSGVVLHNVVSKLNERALFWLDAHFSAGITARGKKDCPIFEELDAIFKKGNFNHIILIDDARLFNGTGDYPTLDQIKQFLFSKNLKYSVKVKYDIIFVLPSTLRN